MIFLIHSILNFLLRYTDELVALNEKFMQARTMYDGMISNSIAKYSSAPSAGSYGYPPSVQPQEPYSGYGYQPNGAAASQPYPAQHHPQPSYGAYHPPQQQSPGPQNQSTPSQQPAYAYNTESTIPQQQTQQPQYEYNNNQYQTSYDQQQQPVQQPTSDYAATSTYNASQDHSGYPPAQQQQNYAVYSTTNAPEGYPPTPNYNSPPPQQTPGQQQPYGTSAAPSQTGTGYPPQQEYAYNH